MGLFNSLFGIGSNNNNSTSANNFDKNNPLDVCYAFGVLAVRVGMYDTCYVQAMINQKDVLIQAILDADTCRFKGAQNLNDVSELMKLDIPKEIASFISSLNGTFKPYVLEVNIPHKNSALTEKDIIESIMRSQQKAILPVKCEVIGAQNGVVVIQIRD